MSSTPAPVAPPSCCGPTRRPTVHELFDRGLSRRRAASLAVGGPLCTGEDGLVARFSLAVAGGLVRTVAFHASTCVTLVAYCELLAERAEGRAPAVAAEWEPEALVAALPGVHPMKHGRARLAVAAFRAAVDQHTKGQPA